MKKLVCLSLLLGLLQAGVANAAVVTIDFEDQPVYTGGFVDYPTIEIDGYSFSASAGVRIIGSAGTKSVVDVGDALNQVGTVTVRRIDGLAFSFYDFAPGFVLSSVDGEVVGGASVWFGDTPIGTGDWLNVTSVSFTTFGTAAALDSITLSTVVPIPAAVWLFGSALLGLDWMRGPQNV